MSASSSSWAFKTLALKVGHVYEIRLKSARVTRFSSNFVTFRTDYHPKMAPKDVEKAFRELRELHRRSRGTSEPVLEAKVVLRGSRKGGWEPSQPSQICCSVGKNEGCRPGGGIPTGAPFWSAPGPPAGYNFNRLCTSAPPLYPRFLDPCRPNSRQPVFEQQVGFRDPHAEAPRVRGVGGLTGLRPLPPTPKKEKFPCQEKCSRVPNRFLFKNNRNFTGTLRRKNWKRNFEENFRRCRPPAPGELFKLWHSRSDMFMESR